MPACGRNDLASVMGSANIYFRSVSIRHHPSNRRWFLSEAGQGNSACTPFTWLWEKVTGEHSYRYIGMRVPRFNQSDDMSEREFSKA